MVRSRKISPAAFAQALIFNGEEHDKLSLLDLKCDLFDQAGCRVSQEAVHKRFGAQAVSFMKELLSQLISSRFCHQLPHGVDSGFFSHIYIKDSSKFKLPVSYAADYPGYGSFNKTTSLMNIQYEYDLLTGDWNSLCLTKATRNDQTDSKETCQDIKPGSLNIRDLGYITSTYLKTVEENQAYYLNRLPKIGVYQKKENKFEPLDWKALDARMKQGRFKYLELEVYLGKDKLKSRMVISPVPREVASERIRKASVGGKRSDGYKLSKQYKIKAHYNIFITNVPDQVLCPGEVAESYSLRWQIELVFKAWKSNLGLHKVKAVKKERMECQLIAKLIWILLNSKILSVANKVLKKTCPDMGCSPIKFLKRAKTLTQTFRLTILKPGLFPEWFNQAIIPLIPDLVVEKRKDKKTHYEIVNEIFVV